MSIFRNEGATCPTCIYQETALRGELDAKRQCKKCINTYGRPGWDPKPNIKTQLFHEISRNGKATMTRRVVS